MPHKVISGKLNLARRQPDFTYKGRYLWNFGKFSPRKVWHYLNLSICCWSQVMWLGYIYAILIYEAPIRVIGFHKWKRILEYTTLKKVTLRQFSKSIYSVIYGQLYFLIWWSIWKNECAAFSLFGMHAPCFFHMIFLLDTVQQLPTVCSEINCVGIIMEECFKRQIMDTVHLFKLHCRVNCKTNVFEKLSFPRLL